VLGCGHNEQGIRQPTTYRPPRGVRHARGVRVDTDDERFRALGSSREHVASVPGTQVKGDPDVSLLKASELADVELVKLAATNDPKHAPRIPRR
jgi:hypothetical protein